MNTQPNSWSSMGSDGGRTATAYAGQSSAQSSGPGTGNKVARVAPGGVDVIPLLCLNTWEHVWLSDYGIRGKMGYVEAWWNRINWAVVANHATAR